MAENINDASINTFVVVAIDFGTARSGYAYAFVDDKKIVGRSKWPGLAAPYPKTRTEILYAPSGEAVSWGFEARQTLAMLNKSDRINYTLLSNFKMLLYDGSGTAGNQICKLATGRSLPVESVIATYLRFMKDEALKEIKSSVAGTLREEDVLWCLTIPAIWRDRDKYSMRRAAAQAGLIEDINSERLLLVLEPEAAAVYCQEQAQIGLKPGDRFMVVDCGGGTIDITSHEVLPSNDLREIAPGTGGAYGSRYVDREFGKFLEQKLGTDILDKLEEDHPKDFLDLKSRWEEAKCEFGPNKAGSRIPFSLGTRLYNLLYQKSPEVLEKLGADQDGDDEYIMIDYKTMEGIFTPILGQIVLKVRESLARMGSPGCDYLLLVGGFSESELLRQVIHKNFASSVRKIIVPTFPSAAIVQGAVSYGLNPQRIRSRRSRLTYGWSSYMRFENGRDPNTKQDTVNGILYCKDRFNKIVGVGEAVSADTPVVKYANPVHLGQKSIKFDFFATSKESVRYTDEYGVTNIGTMTIAMPDITGETKRSVIVKVYFGKTEIKVEARDVTSGRQAHTALRFSSTLSPEILGK